MIYMQQPGMLVSAVSSINMLAYWQIYAADDMATFTSNLVVMHTWCLQNTHYMDWLLNLRCMVTC